MSKAKLPVITEDERSFLKSWLTEHGAGLPEPVRHALEHYTNLVEALQGSHRKIGDLLKQIRRALGIVSSSEKRKTSGDPIGSTTKASDPRPTDPIEKLRLSLTRHGELSSWHKDLASSHRKKGREIENKLKKLEEIELTPEEKAVNAEELRCYNEHLRLGSGADPSFEAAHEAFMKGGDVTINDERESAPVDPLKIPKGEITSRLTEERVRYDFDLQISRITVDVEKLVVKGKDGQTSIISGRTDHIGPPRMEVTWEFLANMLILVSQYAMPFNRFGNLLSSEEKKFTSGKLSRGFIYSAHRLLPVYLHLWKRLANAAVISGDDTSVRVLEIQKALLDIAEKGESAFLERPWLSYATREVAEKSIKEALSPSLGILTGEHLGFEFDRRDGNGPKKSLHTTVLWGRAEDNDPRSAIVFYRSHLGSFGNLLDVLLESRKTSKKNLVIQSDLSSSNLVTNPDVLTYLAIIHAGCTSHARRPFSLYEDDDPDNCAYMLHLFKGLYICEQGLDLYGRNKENSLAVRDIDSRRLWNEILDLATFMSKLWSKETKLGEACRYLIKNFDRLTVYLKDPRIPISNDFSERMLRMERLIEANALFRQTLEGRFALDIVRTILQTAIAAKAPLQEYLTYVLSSSPTEVSSNPEKFTPYYFYHMNLQS